MTPPRTVLTTGVNSGLGLAVALEVARRGFRSVGSVRSPAKAEVVAKAAADAGVEVETVLLDINDAERCAEVIDEVRPWGLVNNAGHLALHRVEDVGDDVARDYFETHAVAPMRLARLSLPHMRAAGGGRIVQVSSVVGRTSFPKLGWYQASKHALEAVTDALRMEVAADGIKISLIEPGAFDSPLADDVNQFQWMRPLWASPEQVTKAVMSGLTSRVPRSRYVVGIDANMNTITAALVPTLVRDRFLRLFTGL
jgi:NAD(P)-dependent dehydrogenase (short-subunit alcohol dehydrogenase family)